MNEINACEFTDIGILLYYNVLNSDFKMLKVWRQHWWRNIKKKQHGILWKGNFGVWTSFTKRVWWKHVSIISHTHMQITHDIQSLPSLVHGSLPGPLCLVMMLMHYLCLTPELCRFLLHPTHIPLSGTQQWKHTLPLRSCSQYQGNCY